MSSASTPDIDADPELSHVIYHSAATEPMSDEALSDLLQEARAKNARMGITGMLLYSEGSFLQVVEGPPTNVEAVIESISRDPRHERMGIIYDEPIPERAFADWSMGFSQFDPNDVDDLEGFTDYLNHPHSLANPGDGRALKLLAAFSQGRWRQRVPQQWSRESRLATTASVSANYSVAFQPIVDLVGRTVFAYEAQVFEPVKGSVDELHPHAGQRSAIASASGKGLATPLYLPFSAHALLDSAATAGTLDVLTDAGLVPSDLFVEVNFDDRAVDLPRLSKALREARKRGLRISLGRFGGAMSELLVLEHIQPDAIAVDPGLTDAIARHGFRQAIVRALISAATDLGITIIAKDVSSSQDFTWLLDEGLTLCQGSLFADSSTGDLPNPSVPLI